ncbi:MAG: HypC/HybG/HupF family hydrogenase formation chaperone [Chitinispirillaceae bacterium]|nr:HypC/HybG/HupF family hydrogenase formation chaperone [Chitinispirillaceae bacterium]
MCLAVPARVVRITGSSADVEVGGTATTADLSVLPDVKVGDYVMVHAGLAIQKYDEREALENLAIIRELCGIQAAP